jgi:hypothetical protein
LNQSAESKTITAFLSALISAFFYIEKIREPWYLCPTLFRIVAIKNGFFNPEAERIIKKFSPVS